MSFCVPFTTNQNGYPQHSIQADTCVLILTNQHAQFAHICVAQWCPLLPLFWVRVPLQTQPAKKGCPCFPWKSTGHLRSRAVAGKRRCRTAELFKAFGPKEILGWSKPRAARSRSERQFGQSSHLAVLKTKFWDPIVVGLGEFTTQFGTGILVFGLGCSLGVRFGF